MDLSHELRLLPDISIAEEARDNNQEMIFHEIVTQPIRYVMDDYSQSVNPGQPSCGRRISLFVLIWRPSKSTPHHTWAQSLTYVGSGALLTLLRIAGSIPMTLAH